MKKLKMLPLVFALIATTTSVLSTASAVYYPPNSPYYPSDVYGYNYNYQPYAYYPNNKDYYDNYYYNQYYKEGNVVNYLNGYYNGAQVWQNGGFQTGAYDRVVDEVFFGVRIPTATLSMVNINNYVQDIWLASTTNEVASSKELFVTTVNAERLPFIQTIAKTPELRLTLNPVKNIENTTTSMVAKYASLVNLKKAGLNEIAFSSGDGVIKACFTISDIISDYEGISKENGLKTSEFDLQIQLSPQSPSSQSPLSRPYTVNVFACDSRSKLNYSELISDFKIELKISGIHKNASLVLLTDDQQDTLRSSKTLNSAKSQTTFFATVPYGTFGAK